jgi:Zn-dependent protease with chaperone function
MPPPAKNTDAPSAAKTEARGVSADIRFLHPFLGKVALLACLSALVVTTLLSVRSDGASLLGGLLRGMTAAVLCAALIYVWLQAVYASIAVAIKEKIEKEMAEAQAEREKAAAQAQEEMQKQQDERRRTAAVQAAALATAAQPPNVPQSPPTLAKPA